MLPVYHRPYDAKLLLLAIPAALIFFHRGGKLGKIAFWLNFAAIMLTADLPWMGLQILVNNLHPASSGAAQHIWTAVWVYPVPLALLSTGVFNLWIYIEHCSGRMLVEGAFESGSAMQDEIAVRARLEPPVSPQFR